MVGFPPCAKLMDSLTKTEGLEGRLFNLTRKTGKKNLNDKAERASAAR